MTEHETLSEARDSRINEAVQFFDDEFQRVQKELSTRRKSLEKEFASKRKTVEKRTRKELKRIQSELKKNPIVKRADAVRKDVTKQVETRVDALLEVHEKEQSFLKSNGQPAATVDQSSITEAPGQQIGRYKLLQKIGEGGFGAV